MYNASLYAKLAEKRPEEMGGEGKLEANGEEAGEKERASTGVDMGELIAMAANPSPNASS